MQALMNVPRQPYLEIEEEFPLNHDDIRVARGLVSFRVQDKDDIFKYNSTEKKVQRAAWLIFSIIVFPVGAIRLVGKLINFIATKTVILPSVGSNLKELNQNYLIAHVQNPHLARIVQRLEITTADNIKLDAVCINNPQQSEKPINEQKYILFFTGNGGCFENSLDFLKKLSEETEANVLSGNYRGVGHSQGFPTGFKDLVMDGEAMVQSLLKQGVSPKNILIHGISMGGGVGAEVAALHQKAGEEINYCGDRTFSSLAKEARELPRRINWVQIENYFNQQIERINNAMPNDEDEFELKRLINVKKKIKIFKPLIKAAAFFSPLAAFLIRVMGWNFDTLNSYKKMKGHKFIIFQKHDLIVPYKASLYKQLKQSQKTQLDKKNKKERRQQLNQPQMNPIEKMYRPKNAIRLDDQIPFFDAHSILITETEHLEDYKNQVARAFE